ncbi:MAG: terminase family protein [Pseudomonadota bacterium]
MNTLDELANATHAAMIELPPYAVLADALDAATTRNERAALLGDVDAETRSAALAYLDAPAAVRERNRRLVWLRADPMRWGMLKRYYALGHVADMVDSWGTLLDPRLLAKGRSALLPFRLWPKQREMFEFFESRYRNGESGVVAKGRDIGASFCLMAWLTSMCLLHENFSAIIGSALEAKCDLSGSSQTLMAKARLYLDGLPEELRGGWNRANGSAHMRIWFENGSALTAQAGITIGRSDRAAVVAIDEHAFVEHAEIVDSAITATSDCRLYVSTPNGTNNIFFSKAHNDAIPRLTITIDDDPRKTPEWRERKIAADGMQRFKREYLCDFLADTKGQLMPREHLDACIDAHVKLGVKPTGRRYAAFDIGGGSDASAFCVVQGILVEQLDSWQSGTNLMTELRRAFALCDKYSVTEMCADAVGIGAAIEGDAQILNAERKTKKLPTIRVVAFKGSESPIFPDRPAVPGSSIKTEDAYLNRKSQSYAWLQYRAAQTFAAVSGEKIKSLDNILSISSTIKERNQLLSELGQIVGEDSTSGKLKIDKYGDGFSPNRADACAMATAPRKLPMVITEATADRLEEALRALPEREGAWA